MPISLLILFAVTTGCRFASSTGNYLTLQPSFPPDLKQVVHPQDTSSDEKSNSNDCTGKKNSSNDCTVKNKSSNENQDKNKKSNDPTVTDTTQSGDRKNRSRLLTPKRIEKYHQFVDQLLCPVYPDGKAPNSGKCDDENTLQDNLQRSRNEILQALQTEIDDSYRTYKSSMFATSAYYGVLTDFAVLGLSGAGTVVGASGTKTILSAMSTGVVGANGSVSKQFFNQQSVLSVIAAMDACRATKQALLAKKQQQPLSSYSLELGVSDLLDYFQSGTLVAGLQWIQEQAGNSKNDAASSSNPTISIFPPSPVSMSQSGLQTFKVTITNLSPTTVTLNVDGIAGGNATVGTIDVAGNYKAPATPGTYTISAISTAAPNLIASTTVTVK